MSNVFYMPAPNYSGVWENSASAALPEFKEGTSIFKFVQEDGAKTAKFSVVDNPKVHRAVFEGLRKAWTSAVCEFEELPPANAVSVVMDRDGVAALPADGNWKMAAKAIISYTV
uniref:Uncharacterized protein n=1 Tax=uncultured bacterium contig00093 TaxID=1181564 RepID=A0A806K0K9_9BACT|nr:hypothetical protein [uncultured bacterium contig00093]